MLQLDQTTLTEEAEKCRLQAMSFLGRPEARFLLRMAREFDDLARRAAAMS
jgi:hypothetical protein